MFDELCWRVEQRGGVQPEKVEADERRGQFPVVAPSKIFRFVRKIFD